jgi:beta-glucosidase
MKFLRFLLYFFLGLLGLIIIAIVGFNLYFWNMNRQAKSDLKEKQILNQNGFKFRDLNGNGKLDIYEDSRQSAETRTEDILSQMTLEEKVGMMWHPPIGVGKDGEILTKPSVMQFSFYSSYDLILKRKIKHFNLFMIPDARNLALWYNNIQKLAEQDRLGIPVTISSDPRHGINNFIQGDLLGGDFSEWPEPIGLAASRDSALVVEFGKIAADELRSVGIRTALHPMADLATEPRWARINGTFGEDADLAATMTTAYIYGFQGQKLGANSVACMTKHWPGGGPQDDGWDAHFRYGSDQVYPGNNFDYHLIPFKAALEAGTAMIMPYYGIAMDQTSENVGMSFNREIIKDLLRDTYGFDGIVCTDWGIVKGFGMLGMEMFEGPGWGVEELSVKERIKKVIDAGVDQFGGNNNTGELLELIREGRITDARIDESVRRLMKVKFQMGLFDDPYVNVALAAETVGKEEYIEKGRYAQRKSIVLLKNGIKNDSSGILPLTAGSKIYIENINKEVAGQYAMVEDSLNDADLAILRIQSPWEKREGNFIESMFHQGRLDFDETELLRIRRIMQQKPTVICIYLDRAAVIPEISEGSAALLADFGANDDAVLDIVFGKFIPTAKLPFELPSSMESVLKQKEDVPYDSGDPLYPFGYGLSFGDDIP